MTLWQRFSREKMSRQMMPLQSDISYYQRNFRHIFASVDVRSVTLS